MSQINLSGKKVLITGANSGIGKVTALRLASLGAHIIMLCRNREKAEEARNEIIYETNNADIFLLLADLSDQKQIRGVCREFCDVFDKLDILINNAGIIDNKRNETPDGIERTLAVNHLAAFLLTNLLIKPLTRAENARIITVSSEAHKYADLDLDNLQLERGFSSFKAYANSKLCNILFTKELAERLKRLNVAITANCLHPGAVATNFGMRGSIWFRMIWFLSKPFLISPEKGADTMVYMASSGDLDHINGCYLKQKKVAEVSSQASNRELAKKLWQQSRALTSLGPEEALL